ncbi:hypothetical protein [Ruminococcus sp.]|uniref:hypothetical protein n=1 Tax=Ruminococcus sp. TaxID=41978 RepID=UPI0025FB78C1|nr:hypothetical protein [Ruminococcus sp.]MBQ8966348.1 hypothetical protein [Ruminococcus sp.]
MINIFKAEFYRMLRTKGFIFFWLFIVITFAISIIYREPGGISFGAPLDYPPDIKLDIAQTAMNFTFYFLLLMPAFCIIATEFGEHTIKNTITSAISKKMYFISKTLFTFFYSLIALIIANYLFYFVNRAVNGTKFSSSLADFSKAFLGQLPVFGAVVSIFIFLAFFLRKGAALNAVAIITPLVYATVSLTMFGINAVKKLAEHLLTYELSYMLSKLAVNCTDSYRTKCYIISAVIMAVCFILGYITFTKREIDC